LVIPFGLSNAPSTSIGRVCVQTLIGRFVVMCFDDLLIISKTEEEHANHLKLMIQVLEKKKLYSNLKKCTLFTLKVIFLGYIVTSNGIQVDESKVEASRSWLLPKSIHYIRSFHVLTSLYRRFIMDFYPIMAPITAMIKGTLF